MRNALLGAVVMAGLASGPAGAQMGAAGSGALISVDALGIDEGTHTVFAVAPRAGAVVILKDAPALAGKNAASARRSVRVGDAPVALAINPRTRRVYVANRASGTLSVLDEQAGEVVATIPVGARPFAVVADPVTNRVVVSNTFNDAMTIVDGATNATTTLQAGGADEMLVPKVGGHVFLTGYEDANLRVLDEATRTMARQPTGQHSWGIAEDPGTGDIWTPLAGSGTIVLLRRGSGERVEIPVGAVPCAVATDSVTHRAYVVNYADETLSVVDGAARRVIATVKVGSHPQAVAVDARRSRVYVANVYGDSVTEIDSVTFRVLATRAAGRNPYALVVSRTTGAVYVADLQGEPVTILPPDQATAP